MSARRQRANATAIRRRCINSIIRLTILGIAFRYSLETLDDSVPLGRRFVLPVPLWVDTHGFDWSGRTALRGHRPKHGADGRLDHAPALGKFLVRETSAALLDDRRRVRGWSQPGSCTAPSGGVAQRGLSDL